ncbi:hypothetical protein PR202_ga31286 [Eleusine coracana subsp. coracana]|uniref:Uncharacterized protein n=1 Tax=Eleusine coracana subsp. coracana TaxID=191504 RepID=A0AAV5DS80_ELECO|nr:hypothetical protein PR202_ga31286 [Eleusine coracana subsp. coracana]
MIKRRFFRQDHVDISTSSSSSSSASDLDRGLEEEEVADEDVGEEQKDEHEHEASGEVSGEEKKLERQVREESSGYQSEDSSGHDVDGPSADDDDVDEHISSEIKEHTEISFLAKKADSGNADSAKDAADRDDLVEADFANCILKCKSVYKCKLCPRIMCLNEEMVRVHLKSKRHARSKKLLGEGRLKLMLNSDGELEEEQETHAERHARTMALAQVFALFESLLIMVFS